MAANTRAFMREVEAKVRAIPSVEKVRFFGSILTGHFRVGKSDLDMVVQGHIDDMGKRRVILIVKEANDKYGLHLESSPYLHPVPFFITNQISQIAFDELFKGKLFPELLAQWRSERKEKLDITTGEYWAGKRAKFPDPRHLAERLWGIP